MQDDEIDFREDKLPQKICDGCSYKLEVVYDFRNTTVNAEKQLLSWLNESQGAAAEASASTPTKQVVEPEASQVKPTETFVKQEAIDPSDLSKEEDDVKNYVFPDKYDEPLVDNKLPENEDEPPPPKRAKRTAAVKAAIAIDDHESDEDDDDSGEPLTKVEDESDDGSDEDNNFVDMPSTSADDQPGPSGVGKDGGEAPYNDRDLEEIVIQFISDDESSEIPLKLEQFGENEDEDIRPKLELIDFNQFSPEMNVNYEENMILNGPLKLRKPPMKQKRKRSDKISIKFSLCVACGKLIPDAFMSNHMRSHQITQCNICSETFEKSEDLAKHKETHSHRDYLCDICEEGFSSPYNYSVHNSKHIMRYDCPICSFQTKSRSSLKGHIKRHKGEYTCFCSVCGRGFISKGLLESHEEIHLDIKRYGCDFCDKKFAVKRYLDAHRQLNHRKELFGIEALFKCDLCDKTFTFEKSLKRHKSVIHHVGEDRTVRCKVCDKLIANNYNLKIHMRTHTGEKRYCCELCGKAFTAFKYWKNHKLSHERRANENDGQDIGQELADCYVIVD